MDIPALQELKKVGVNFFPEPDGHNYVSVTDKVGDYKPLHPTFLQTLPYEVWSDEQGCVDGQDYYYSNVQLCISLGTRLVVYCNCQ